MKKKLIFILVFLLISISCIVILITPVDIAKTKINFYKCRSDFYSLQKEMENICNDVMQKKNVVFPKQNIAVMYQENLWYVWIDEQSKKIPEYNYYSLEEGKTLSHIKEVFGEQVTYIFYNGEYFKYHIGDYIRIYYLNDDSKLWKNDHYKKIFKHWYVAE